MDTLSCDSGTSVVSTSYVSSLVPSHRPWASKSGRHALGPAEDYDALCEQIARGQTLLAEMDLQIREAPVPMSQELVTKVTLVMARRERDARGAGGGGRRQGGRGASPGKRGQERQPRDSQGGSGLQVVRCSGGTPAEACPCATAVTLPHGGLGLSFSPVACPSVLPPGHWSVPLPASALSVAKVLILTWRARIAQSLGVCLPTRAALRPLRRVAAASPARGR